MHGPTCIFWANLTPSSLVEIVQVFTAAWTPVYYLTGICHEKRFPPQRVCDRHFGSGRDAPPHFIVWCCDRRTRTLIGENIHRYPMSLTNFDCQVSELVNSDTYPRVTTARQPLSPAAQDAALLEQRRDRPPRRRVRPPTQPRPRGVRVPGRHARSVILHCQWLSLPAIP